MFKFLTSKCAYPSLPLPELLTYSDVMKLSLLYFPVHVSKGLYDPLSLCYYALLRGDAGWDDYIPSELKGDEDYVLAVLCWKFGIKYPIWDQVLTLLQYLPPTTRTYKSSYNSKLKDMRNFTSGLCGPGGCRGPLGIPGPPRFNFLTEKQSHKLSAVIVSCSVLEVGEQITLLLHLDQLRNNNVMRGILGIEPVSNNYLDLYQLGRAFTYKVGKEQLERYELHITSVEQVEESKYSETQLGYYYIIKGDFVRYYEWKHKGHKVQCPPYYWNIRGFLSLRSGAVDGFPISTERLYNYN